MGDSVGQNTLANFVKARRVSLGLNQSEFAEIAGIKRAHLSQIENGRITLPGPDLRRKLARALGVSHLDLMIAAGELTPDEALGQDPFSPPENPNDAWAQEVWAMARAVEWDDSRLNAIMALMSAWVDEDRTGWRRRRNEVFHGYDRIRGERIIHEDSEPGGPSVPVRWTDEHGVPRLRYTRAGHGDPDANTTLDLERLCKLAEEQGADGNVVRILRDLTKSET